MGDILACGLMRKGNYVIALRQISFSKSFKGEDYFINLGQELLVRYLSSLLHADGRTHF